MMIKNCTNFALIAGIGLSLFSESSQTALTTMGHEDSHMTVSARSPARLGPITVLHHYDDGFSVLNKGTKHVVENHLVGKELRTIAEAHSLEAFLENGYISVNRGNDNKYSLQARGRLMGGGGSLGKPVGHEATSMPSTSPTGTSSTSPTGTSSTFDTSEKLSQPAEHEVTKMPSTSTAGTSSTADTVTQALISVATTSVAQAAVDRLGAWWNPPADAEQYEQHVKKYKLAFSECLLANIGEARDVDGIPDSCTEQFTWLKAVVTAAEIDEITRYLKEDATQN